MNRSTDQMRNGNTRPAASSTRDSRPRTAPRFEPANAWLRLTWPATLANASAYRIVQLRNIEAGKAACLCRHDRVDGRGLHSRGWYKKGRSLRRMVSRRAPKTQRKAQKWHGVSGTI